MRLWLTKILERESPKKKWQDTATRSWAGDAVCDPSFARIVHSNATSWEFVGRQERRQYSQNPTHVVDWGLNNTWKEPIFVFENEPIQFWKAVCWRQKVPSGPNPNSLEPFRRLWNLTVKPMIRRNWDRCDRIVGMLFKQIGLELHHRMSWQGSQNSPHCQEPSVCSDLTERQ